MKSRRTFLISLGVMSVSRASQAFGQPSTRRPPRVGVLWHAGSEEEERVPLGALRQGLKDMGYVEGRTILLENRYPNEEPDRFVSLAAELAKLNVDVLVAVTRPAALAARQATSTIPIVFLAVPDPVGDRLVETLARPGKQITGITNMALELVPKRIELLKEALPQVSRLGLLVNVSHAEGARRYMRIAETAAASLGITVQPVEVRGPDDFDQAFSFIRDSRLQGLSLTVDGLFYANQQRLIRLAIDRRVPMIMYAREMAANGALMSYGPSNTALFHRGAYFIDRILRGAKPADVPVEQPPVIELFVNSQTAKAIGVSIAPAVLHRANDVL